MTTATEQNVFVSDFERLRGRGPRWLDAIRTAGIDAFATLGFPTTRNEEWRFTNLRPLAETAFRHAADAGPVSAGQVAQFAIDGLTGPVLVFVDGRYQPDLSDLSGLGEGVTAGGLGEAIEAGNELVEKHLGRYAAVEAEHFNALNTAFIEDGGFVHVAKGVAADAPIRLLFIASAGGDPLAVHPRNLIVAEANSQVTVIEHYAALGEAAGFTNAVTEVVAGDGSNVEHYLLDEESEASFNISTLRVQQSRDSNFASHSVLLGGGLVRNNVHPVLAGEGCHSLLNGLYICHGSQHMDNHMRVEHAAAHCDSRQFYRGILEGESRAVFSGRIIVAEGAQKTDAKQSNSNLLLSDKCQVDTKPQLEIYADDVKCTHGATIGQIDDEAVFYLRSRGVPEELARAILVQAFAGESLDRMKLEPIRQRLGAALLARLPGGKMLTDGE